MEYFDTSQYNIASSDTSDKGGLIISIQINVLTNSKLNISKADSTNENCFDKLLNFSKN